MVAVNSLCINPLSALFWAMPVSCVWQQLLERCAETWDLAMPIHGDPMMALVDYHDGVIASTVTPLPEDFLARGARFASTRGRNEHSPKGSLQKYLLSIRIQTIHLCHPRAGGTSRCVLLCLSESPVGLHSVACSDDLLGDPLTGFFAFFVSCLTPSGTPGITSLTKPSHPHPHPRVWP